jgi:hypothetical protein
VPSFAVSSLFTPPVLMVPAGSSVSSRACQTNPP